MAARRSSSRSWTTCSSSSRPRSSSRATCSPTGSCRCPPSDRPKTAAYAELDDPFAAPIAENIRHRFEAAGIKTVYKQVYPAETQDFSPIMAKVAAAKPDVLVGGTQSEDAYAQVKSLVQLKFSPKFMFLSNGANSPVEFPDKVGAANTAGIMSSGDWFPGSTGGGQRRVRRRYIKKYGGTADTIDNNSAEAYAAGSCSRRSPTKTGKIDNATIITTLHQGTWPTLARRPQLGRSTGAPQRQLPPDPVAERQARAGVPGCHGAGRPGRAQARLGRVIGERCTPSIQGVILGVLTGGVYALMASGQTLIFGIMKVVNLAQGALVILGAYLAYQLFTSARDRSVPGDPDHHPADVRPSASACSWPSCGRCAARTAPS